MHPAGIEVVLRESATGPRCADHRDTVREIGMVEGRLMYQECPVTPPLEHRASANHHVRECNVSAFDAPLTDEGLKLIEGPCHDVLHDRPPGSRGGSLSLYLIGPALQSALPIEERENGARKVRREERLVVREIRKNREPVARHVLALPSRILEATA